MDLNAPLGMGPPPPSRRPLIIAAAGFALIAVAGLVYLLVTADPHGGEPYAVAALPAPHTAQSSAAPSDAAIDTMPTGSLAVPGGANSAPPGAAPGRPEQFDQGTFENGVRVFRGTEPTGAQPPQRGPLVIDVTRQLDATPQRAKTGGRPAVSNGMPPNAEAAAMPRIAIYVSGMGLSKSATRTATETMPPAVALAFVPYGDTVSASVDAARAKGHEVLLQLPMQNAQGGTPGPHALRPNEPVGALASDLDWLMSRFKGFDGVTNLLGAPVTADTTTMTELLKTTGNRNLFFLDDGTSKRSMALALAAQLNVSAAQVDVVLDATADPAIVQANLEALVAIARRKGQAIGMASGLPEHLGAIARFASDLSSKNVTLVPVSALARRDSNIATNGR